MIQKNSTYIPYITVKLDGAQERDSLAKLVR